MNKIVHVMIACFYKNGFGYQENILPEKHKELGFDVNIVTYNKGGDASYKGGTPPITYLNPDGIPVHVLKDNTSFFKKVPLVNMFVNVTSGLYNKIEELQPDILFVHGICSSDNMEIVRYKKNHPNVKLYADNHSDYYNAPVKTIRQKIYRRLCGRRVGKKIGKLAEKVWGVTPWRVVYQEKVYGIPKDKSALLVMGGDEKKIHWDERCKIRMHVRHKMQIPQNAFVFITGGKIDRAKNIHLLVEAFEEINNSALFLIIFGRYEEDMKYFSSTIKNKNIKNIGWISADEAYDYYLASDFAVFPGTHSVLWEQACASGTPALFKDWDGGFNHVDVGGNCILLKNVTKETLKRTMLKVIEQGDVYASLKENAISKARKEFSYIEIAQRSIGL